MTCDTACQASAPSKALCSSWKGGHQTGSLAIEKLCLWLFFHTITFLQGWAQGHMLCWRNMSSPGCVVTRGLCRNFASHWHVGCCRVSSCFSLRGAWAGLCRGRCWKIQYDPGIASLLMCFKDTIIAYFSKLTTIHPTTPCDYFLKSGWQARCSVFTWLSLKTGVNMCCGEATFSKAHSGQQGPKVSPSDGEPFRDWVPKLYLSIAKCQHQHCS